MPFSAIELKQETKEYIFRKFPGKWDTTILDVGAGAGNYVRLLEGRYPNMDACEIWEPYIRRFKLHIYYRNVFNCSLADLPDAKYGLIIMGDVLEHMTTQEAQKQIARWYPQCKELLVVVPFNCVQEPTQGNPYEEHLQSDLNRTTMRHRYGKWLKPLFYGQKKVNGEYEIAVYRKA